MIWARCCITRTSATVLTITVLPLSGWMNQGVLFNSFVATLYTVWSNMNLAPRFTLLWQWPVHLHKKKLARHCLSLTSIKLMQLTFVSCVGDNICCMNSYNHCQQLNHQTVHGAVFELFSTMSSLLNLSFLLGADFTTHCCLNNSNDLSTR
jgi:hypothetical protein